MLLGGFESGRDERVPLVEPRTQPEQPRARTGYKDYDVADGRRVGVHLTDAPEEGREEHGAEREHSEYDAASDDGVRNGAHGRKMAEWGISKGWRQRLC